MTCNNCGAQVAPMHVHNNLNYCSYECIEESEQSSENISQIRFFDIGLDDNPLHNIDGIVDHLCSNQNITISLNKENSDSFSGKDMIALAYFISEVEPMVSLEATSNYRKTGGDCLVGEMIFTYYDRESKQTTVVKI